MPLTAAFICLFIHSFINEFIYSFRGEGSPYFSLDISERSLDVLMELLFLTFFLDFDIELHQ